VTIYQQTLRFVQGRKAAGYDDTESHNPKAPKKGLKTK
jgi:hypothetical protein